MNYKPELDGIRAISILLVIISHAGFGHIIPGGLGVTIFFFVSGYLITSLLLAEADVKQHIDLYKFYMRRFWRLLPPLIFFICIAIATVLLINHRIKLTEIASAFFYYANYYKIFIHYDTLNGYPSPFNILWSLAIEEHFYILYAPLIAFTFKSRRYLPVLYLMVILPFFVRIFSVMLFPELLVEGGYNYSSTEARIDSIAMGCLLAVMFQKHEIYDRVKSVLLRDSVMFLAMAVLLFTLLLRDLYFRETFRYSIQNIAIFALVANLMFSSSSLSLGLKDFLSKSFMTHIGKLSYSFYLFHWIAYVYCYQLIGEYKLTLPWQALYWSLTLILSYFSYLIVEKKTKKFRWMYGSNAN